MSDEKDVIEESALTMVDVLEEQEELVREYNAVLGASDEKCCTYSKGAIKRQALYSCLTCCPESRENLDKCAGICLACSYRCHENHELIELYTKRKFRCDCPTERLATNCCVLNGNVKPSLPRNLENKYNQNFQGNYCTCKRPYPDPEGTNEENMLQCGICEDWFHLTHLSLDYDASKVSEDSTEMICTSCMEHHAFLNDYRGYALKAIEQEPRDKKVESESKANEELDVETSDEPKAKMAKLEEYEETKDLCCRPKNMQQETTHGATFWGNDWREVLCKCAQCLSVYKTENLEFLLDPEDSAKNYEDRGIMRAQSEATNYEEGIQEALASVDRVKLIDALTEFNHLKDKLKEFFGEFASSNKIVTKDDITTFFEKMREEGRERAIPPNFCR